MRWDANQGQEAHAQTHYDDSSGYDGSLQQPARAYGDKRVEQQIFDAQEHQPLKGFEQLSYGQQLPYPPAPSLSGTSIAAILCYSLGWFSGLLFFLFAGENRFVRFHALQAMLFFGSINVLDIAVFNFEKIRWLHMPYLSGFVLLFFMLMNIIACIGWVVGMIQAARGKYYRLPIIGDFVARVLNPGVTVK